MKAIYNIGWLIMVILFTGCAGQKVSKQAAILPLLTGKVTPAQLVEKNGQVSYKYQLNIPPRVFSRNMVLMMTPKLTYAGGERRYASFGLQGQAVVLSKYPVVKYKEGINTIYDFTFPYEQGMENMVLAMDMEAWECGKLRWRAEAILNSNGIKKEITSDNDTVKHKDMTGEIRGELMFKLGETALAVPVKYLDYTRDYLDTLLKVPGLEVTRMEMITSCSPEGPLETNKELALDRYTVSKRLLTDFFGLNRIPAFQNPNFLTYRLVYQNWQGLYDLIEDSHIPDRYQILDNFKNSSDKNREVLLERMMKEYPIIENEFLPLLRRTEFIIYYKRPYEKLKPVIVPGW